LYDLQLEAGVKDSSRFRVAHGLYHFDFNNLSDCLLLLDHYTHWHRTRSRGAAVYALRALHTVSLANVI